MLPELFIQQLKQSCDMERIVSGYLPLKKKGRYLVGLCPFHSEKSPSFYVYPQNQSFYCFGCGAGLRRRVRRFPQNQLAGALHVLRPLRALPAEDRCRHGYQAAQSGKGPGRHSRDCA